MDRQRSKLDRNPFGGRGVIRHLTRSDKRERRQKKMETTLEGLMNGTGITASIVEDWNDNAPDWAHSKARHYRVKIRYQKRSMSLWYYQGLGITRPPRPADVVECLACDSLSEYESLDDFIFEMGLEIKSVQDFRNFEKQYKQLKNQNKRFTHLIGNPDLIQRMREVA